MPVNQCPETSTIDYFVTYIFSLFSMCILHIWDPYKRNMKQKH